MWEEAFAHAGVDRAKYLGTLPVTARLPWDHIDVGLEEGATRRQLTVSGMGLNDLIGKRFRVGEVECYGVMICEPCLHLQELTRPGIIKELVHRAGLNADIVTDGRISVGDEVVALDDA